MDAFLQSQIDFIVALQSIPGLAGLMEFFSFLGREEFFILLLPLVYLCFDPATGIRLGIVLLAGDSINVTAKFLAHLPRPYWMDTRVLQLSEEPAYGFPSGHAQNGISVWLFLASVTRKPWVWASAGILVLLISLSRIYLGMHFPSDIVGGWIIGAVFLFAFFKIEPFAADRLSRMRLEGQIATVFVASLAIVLVGALASAFNTGVTDSAVWAALAGEALKLDGIVADAGALFGIGAGWAMARRWAAFNARDALGKRAGRFVVGLLTVGALYFSLRAIFPTEPEALGLTFRYIRYTFMGWGAVFFTPWLCLKVRLAEPAS